MNLKLLKECRAWVAAGGDDQYTWDQAVWYETPDTDPVVECGTACCIAGYAVAKTVGVTRGGWNHRSGRYWPLDGSYWDVAGQKALGLTEEEAADLFSANNRRDDVLRILDELIAKGESNES